MGQNVSEQNLFHVSNIYDSVDMVFNCMVAEAMYLNPRLVDLRWIYHSSIHCTSFVANEFASISSSINSANVILR